MSLRLVGGSGDRAVGSITSNRPESGVRSTASAVRAAALGSSSADISRDAVMLDKLSSLHSAQPSRFRAISGEITSRLKAEADTRGGDVGRKLGELADKFSEAARTGDVSSLRPGSRSSMTPARGADAYRQSASRAPGAGDVEQLIADALKDLNPRTL